VSADQVPAGGAEVAVRNVSSGRLVLGLPVPDAFQTAMALGGSAITSWAGNDGYLWRRVGTGWRREAFGARHVVTNFSDDGSVFAVVDPGHGTQIRSARSGAVLRQIPTESSSPVAALSPGGQVLATSDLDGVVRLWSTTTGRELRELAGLSGEVSSLEFSPSGNLLLAAGAGGVAIVWDIANGQVATDVTASQGHLYQAVFAPDDRTIYTVAQDGTVASWDLTGHRGFGTLATVPDGAVAVALSPDGSRLLLGTGTGELSVLNGVTFAVERRITVAGAVTALAVDPSGRLAAVGTENGSLDIVDLATGAIVTRVAGLRAVGGLAWSPDGHELAADDEQRRRALVIDTATGQAAAAFRVPGPPWQVAWSGDGTLLAIGLLGGSVAIADPRAGVVRRRLPVSRDPFPPSVAFTHGHVLAIGGRDGSVRFWDAASGVPLSGPIPAITGVVQQLSVSRDGTLLAAAGDDGSLVLVDADSYQRLGAALPAPPGDLPVLAVVDSRHARLIAVYTTGPATVWRLEPGAWLARACGVPDRRLTRAEWRLYLGARPYAPAC
jgi:WD40 repeat protein